MPDQLPLFPEPEQSMTKRKAYQPSFTDLDPSGWRDHDDIITESLWLLGSRDNKGPHTADYWGNFVPQIPYQLMRRYTCPEEVVVDLFSGLGTTLIECRHLGRHGIGIELNQAVAERSRSIIAQATNEFNISTEVIIGDSTTEETSRLIISHLQDLGINNAGLVLMHPPYHDIIKFSDDPQDLSNAPDEDAFLQSFAGVAANAYTLLAPGRFMGLVIGDKYTGGEWVPLGFHCMQVCQDAGFLLKAINVKDIQGNERGKGKATNLWKYRALKLGFYIFKHEYVMVFQKPK